jgi:hypothetical protein
MGLFRAVEFQPRPQDPSKRSGSGPVVVTSNLNAKILIEEDGSPRRSPANEAVTRLQTAQDEHGIRRGRGWGGHGHTRKCVLGASWKDGFVYVISAKRLVLRLATLFGPHRRFAWPTLGR